MKHSLEQLLSTVYEIFPRGMARSDPRYSGTPEVQRQKAVRVPVGGRYDAWRNMLARLEERFPKERFPGVEVDNRCCFLQNAAVGFPWDRCFSGRLTLPVRTPNEHRHELDFLVSFVVPYYVIASASHGPLRKPSGELDLDTCWSFDFSPDEAPFAAAIGEEIRATFPGHEPIDPELGLTVVPDVEAGNHDFGEATIFCCLFSDAW